MLPSVPQLMPPLPLYDLRFIDLIYGPEMGVFFIQEDRLEDVVFIGDGGFVWGRGFLGVLTELVLVICAVEGHFDFMHVFFVGVGVIHWSIASRFIIWTGGLVFRERDLLFLRFGLGFRAQVGGEAGFVVLLEVVCVRVGDCDVIEEFCATKHELFFPICSFPQELFGVVGEDTYY